MKKSITKFTLAIALCLTSITAIYAQAPSYKNFEWDIVRAGYANLTTSDIQKGGIALGGELRFNLTDFYSIGLSGDVNFAASSINGDNADIEVMTNSSLTVDRYFDNTSGNRPFVGVSIGRYESFRQFIRDGEDLDPFDEHSSFGMGVRVGYEFNHLRLMGQYQHSTSGDVLNGFSVTAALTLWGGYKG